MKRGSGRRSYAKIQEQKRRQRETCWWMGWCMLVCTAGGIVLLYAAHQRVKLQALSLLALGGMAGGNGNATSALRGSTKPAAATGSSASSISGQRQQRLQAPQAVSLEEIQARLRLHPFALLLQSQSSPQHPPLEDVLWHMHNHTSCLGKPIFTTMANVGSSLYWQLIENFVYTMGKFGLTDCALMICVSDPHCMELCKQSLFPCYDYQHQPSDGGQRSKVHPMEQIAQLKLFHMPRALLRGVDLFMLDLDVGFLDDPMRLVEKFYSAGQAGGRSRRERVPGAEGAGSGPVDALVQEDVVFIMNRSVEGWKQWWTEPMPNIGLFLVSCGVDSLAPWPSVCFVCAPMLCHSSFTPSPISLPAPLLLKPPPPKIPPIPPRPPLPTDGRPPPRCGAINAPTMSSRTLGGTTRPTPKRPFDPTRARIKTR